MEIIYLLIPIPLLISFGFLGAFIWAVKKGQFEDLETPRHQILVDEKKRHESVGEQNKCQ